jgi:hypothetical protein
VRAVPLLRGNWPTRTRTPRYQPARGGPSLLCANASRSAVPRNFTTASSPVHPPFLSLSRSLALYLPRQKNEPFGMTGRRERRAEAVPAGQMPSLRRYYERERERERERDREGESATESSEREEGSAEICTCAPLFSTCLPSAIANL